MRKQHEKIVQEKTFEYFSAKPDEIDFFNYKKNTFNATYKIKYKNILYNYYMQCVLVSRKEPGTY